MQPKDYLGSENSRNRQHAKLYTDMVQRAMGAQWAVLVGHHVLYECDGDVSTEGEIPSADTLLFDHPIMTALFGERAIPIMQELAALPCESREDCLAAHFYGASNNGAP